MRGITDDASLDWLLAPRFRGWKWGSSVAKLPPSGLQNRPLRQPTHQATEALADDSKSIPPRWPRTGRRRRRRLVRKVSWGVGQKRPSAQPHCSQERGARDKRGANSADRVRSVTNCHHHCTASCQVQRKQPSDQRSTAHTSDGKKGGKIPPFGQRVGG